MGKISPDHFESDRLHRIAKSLAVLGFVNRILRCANHLNAELFQYTVAHQVQGTVQAGLAAHGGQQRIRTFFFDNQRNRLPSNRFDIGCIGKLRIGHDGGRIGIHQNDPVALLAQRLAGLNPGIIKLAGLSDYDRTGADHQNRGDISSLGHDLCFLLFPSGQRTDQRG